MAHICCLLAIGAIASVIMRRILVRKHGPQKDLPFFQKIQTLDILGTIFLTSDPILLFLALQWGVVVYPWSDSKLWGSSLGCLLFVALFIAWQFHKQDEQVAPFLIQCLKC
jgi:hypothetical protein